MGNHGSRPAGEEQNIDEPEDNSVFLDQEDEAAYQPVEFEHLCDAVSHPKEEEIARADLSTEFETPELGELVKNLLPRLVDRHEEQLKDVEFVEGARDAWKGMKERFESGIKDTGLDVKILTKPIENPLLSFLLIRLFFPPKETDPTKGFLDLSIKTMSVLQKTGLSELIEEGKVNYIDLHSCGSHSSSKKDPSFPKPNGSGKVRWDTHGCSNAVNVVCETLNREVEEWRQNHLFGITVNTGKTSTVPFGKAVRASSAVPSTFSTHRQVQIPERFGDTGARPVQTAYHFQSSPYLVDKSNPLSTSPDIAPSPSPSSRQAKPLDSLDSLDPLEQSTSHSSNSKNRQLHEVSFSSYLSIDLCHPSYASYAPTTASYQTLPDIIAFDTILIELGDLLSLESQFSRYNFLTTRIFLHRVRTAGGFTIPPSVKVAMGFVEEESERMVAGGDRPLGLLKSDLPDKYARLIAEGAEAWEGYGMESIGRSIKPRTLITKAIAAWKAQVQQGSRILIWPIRLESTSSFPSFAVTSDLRFPTIDGVQGSTNLATIIRDEQRAAIRDPDGESLFPSLSTTTDLRFATIGGGVQSLDEARMVKAQARAGLPTHESSFPALSITSDLRFASINGERLVMKNATTARDAQRAAVSEPTKGGRFQVIEITSDLRFATINGGRLATNNFRNVLDSQRLGLPQADTSAFPSLVVTTDLRAPSVDGGTHQLILGEETSRAQRGAISSTSDGSVFPSFTVTTDLRAPSVDGTNVRLAAGRATQQIQRTGLGSDQTGSSFPSLAATSDLRLPSATMASSSLAKAQEKAQETKAAGRIAFPPSFDPTTDTFPPMSITSDLRFATLNSNAIASFSRKRKAGERGDGKY